MMAVPDIKKVLVVQYSQTGQLSRIVSSITEPLTQSADVVVTTLTIEPEEPYPFPWDFFSFFDVFPESVYLDPPAIKRLAVDDNEDFDLIIIAYQVWFLSPSLPITAFMKSEIGKKLIKDKPVITVIGCRNMWVMAQETMKTLIHDAGARLIDNIALVDQGSALASFVTTPRWLLSGKKNAFFGFPPAGVSKEDIRACSRFGSAVLQGLYTDREKTGQSVVSGLGAAKTDYSLIQSEKIGFRSFMIWGKLIRKVGKPGDSARKPILVIYLVFLITMIITVVPINMLLKKLLAPFKKEEHKRLQKHYELPSGSGTERMDEFPCR
jgi:hypothetical protein